MDSDIKTLTLPREKSRMESTKGSKKRTEIDYIPEKTTKAFLWPYNGQLALAAREAAVSRKAVQ